jgi:hypothetical protein
VVVDAARERNLAAIMSDRALRIARH